MEADTATMEAPAPAPAKSDPTKAVLKIAKRLGQLEAARVERTNPPPPDRSFFVAIDDLSLELADVEIPPPEPLRPILLAALSLVRAKRKYEEKLRFAEDSPTRRGPATPDDDFLRALDALIAARAAYPKVPEAPPPLESIKLLKEQKVPARQIALIWGLSRLEVELEIAEPGSVVKPDFVPHQQRMREEQRRAEDAELDSFFKFEAAAILRARAVSAGL